MHTRTNSKKAESKFPPPPEHKKGIFVRFEISMTQDVDPRDNVIAERVNGILLD